MSRAFVKEPDGDLVADELTELPQEPIPNYVTPEGFAALETWRDELKDQLAKLDDDKENITDRSRRAHVERDLRYVRVASSMPWWSTRATSRPTRSPSAPRSRSPARTARRSS